MRKNLRNRRLHISEASETAQKKSHLEISVFGLKTSEYTSVSYKRPDAATECAHYEGNSPSGIALTQFHFQYERGCNNSPGSCHLGDSRATEESTSQCSCPLRSNATASSVQKTRRLTNDYRYKITSQQSLKRKHRKQTANENPLQHYYLEFISTWNTPSHK